MRASEIRNLLIQKYGVDTSVVSKILDKGELKQMLLNFMVKQQTKDQIDHIKSTVLHVLYSLLVLIMLFFAFKPIAMFLRNIRSNDNKTLFKLKLVMSNYKKRNYFGFVTLLLSFVLEVVVSAMTLSTFLSWVLSYDSPYRRFMMPMLSFPVNSEMIRNIAKGDTRNNSNPLSVSPGGGGFGIDIGPMLTIMAVNWAIKKLEEVSASTVMKDVHRREDRKARKQFRKQFGLERRDGEQQATEQGSGGSSGVSYEEDLFAHGIDPHAHTNPSREQSSEEREEMNPAAASFANSMRNRFAKTNNKTSSTAATTAATETEEEQYRDTAHLYSQDDHVDVCATAFIASQHDPVDGSVDSQHGEDRDDDMPALHTPSVDSAHQHQFDPESSSRLQSTQELLQEQWDEEQEEESGYEILSRTEQYNQHSHLD